MNDEYYNGLKHQFQFHNKLTRYFGWDFNVSNNNNNDDSFSKVNLTH